MTQENAPTRKEIEDGLNHKNVEVRIRLAARLDFTPTPTQIERGLTDSDSDVRFFWAVRPDFTPTVVQAERGLNDSEEMIRRQWAVRLDFTPNEAQIVRGLTDEYKPCRHHWTLRPGLSLSLEALSGVVKTLREKQFKPLPAELETRLRSHAEAAQLSAAFFRGFH